MDPQEFLAQGPLQSLLVLMIVPVFSALVLVGYIAFSFNRRKKKSKMKLGTQPKKKTEPSTMNSVSDVVPSEGGPLPADKARVDVLEQSINPISQSGMEASSAIVEEPIDLSARLKNAQPEPSAGSQPEQPAEMLRLLRQPRTGQLLVEIAGRQYIKLADITDRDVGQLVLQLAAHLLAFTNGNIFTQEGMKNLPRPKVDSLPQLPADGTSMEPSVVSGSDSQVQPTLPEVEAEFLASLRSEKISSPRRPSSAWHRELQRGREQPTSTSAAVGVPGLNLAHEINEIVKEKLSRSPLADTTRIEITSNLDGSLRIIVNNQNYSAPDDIPDEAARTLIKTSIKEWERR